MDVLTDVLRSLHLRGTVYFEADFRAPWGMEMRAGAVSNFHLVQRGHCWLRMPGRAPAMLGPGDLVVLPHGDTHALAHAADTAAKPAPEVIASGTADADGQPVFGGEGEATTLLCGHFECDRSGAHPLLRSLPPVLRLGPADRQEPAADWFLTITKLAAAESAGKQPGSGAIVDRLAEVLLIQVIRAAEAQGPWQTGFLAALADPRLHEALTAIHEQPAFPWTVRLLSEHAAMSRAAFASHFRERVGMGPIQYVTQWRMQQARHLLQATEQSTAQVAHAVGYSSEWAFAKAFKRTFGAGPGALRRAE